MTEITKEAIDTALSETPFIPNDGNRAWMKAAITAALSTLPIAGEGKVKALLKAAKAAQERMLVEGYGLSELDSAIAALDGGADV